MASKTTPASASAEAAPPPAPSQGSGLVSYRVLPKGAGLIHTGEHDAATGEPFTFGKGAVVAGADPALAAELEDRGLVEVLGQA